MDAACRHTQKHLACPSRRSASERSEAWLDWNCHDFMQQLRAPASSARVNLRDFYAPSRLAPATGCYESRLTKSNYYTRERSSSLLIQQTLVITLDQVGKLMLWVSVAR